MKISNQNQNDISLVEFCEKPPYLPPPKNKSYTLVLDLDETLVHYQEV